MDPRILSLRLAYLLLARFTVKALPAALDLTLLCVVVAVDVALRLAALSLPLLA